MLEQSKRALVQLEADIQARKEQTDSQLAVFQQQRNQSLINVQRELMRIAQTRSLAPITGLVSIRQNRGGFINFGQQVPEIREGDTLQPGMPVADVLDLSELEVWAKIGELDRANLKEGQEAVLQLDAIPDKQFRGTIKNDERHGDCRRLLGRSLQEIRRGLRDRHAPVAERSGYEAGGRGADHGDRRGQRQEEHQQHGRIVLLQPARRGAGRTAGTTRQPGQPGATGAQGQPGGDQPAAADDAAAGGRRARGGRGGAGGAQREPLTRADAREAAAQPTRRRSGRPKAARADAAVSPTFPRKTARSSTICGRNCRPPAATIAKN